MQRFPVSSSRISSVGWAMNILEVQFKDGAIYQYFDVPYNEFIRFIDSPSLGRALSSLDKVHRYIRVN